MHFTWKAISRQCGLFNDTYSVTTSKLKADQGRLSCECAIISILTGSASVHDGEGVDSDGRSVEEGQSTETVGNRVIL